MPHSQGIAYGAAGPEGAECIITLTPPPGRGRTVEQRLDAIDAQLDALCEGLARIAVNVQAARAALDTIEAALAAKDGTP